MATIGGLNWRGGLVIAAVLLRGLPKGRSDDDDASASSTSAEILIIERRRLRRFEDMSR
jgi:hypothetical protein